MLGDACFVNGALGCHGAAQKLTLRCDGGFWRANGTCDLNTNCDQRNGLCTAIPLDCKERMPGQRFCRMDTLVACGVDNITVDDVEDCVGRCAETGDTAQCIPPDCGDGRVQSPEQCDDGNLSNTDDCTNACASAVCGDRFIWAGRETCDDGNQTTGDLCSPTCVWEARAVSAGNTNTCALGANFAVQCWGYNVYGQSGLGDTVTRGDTAGEVGPNLPVVDLGSGRTARFVTTRILSSCAILDNGALKCWGYNGYGQLGLGDSVNRGSAAGQMGNNLPPVDLGRGPVKAVAVGGYHTCAILDDDSLKCWGYNIYGGLGLGDAGGRGTSSGHMGNYLPLVDLGTGRKARAVAAGIYSTCALLDDGRVKCWGYNAFGQLGTGDTLARGDGAGEMGDALAPVDLGTGRTAKAIAMGSYQACAILDDDSLKCWGHNLYGQLGLGDTAHRGDSAGEMGDALPTVNLGTGRTARAVASGDGFTCALLDTNQIKCWGAGTYGRLGLGDTSQRGDASGEMGDALPTVNFGMGRRVLSFDLGAGHGCAVLDTLAIKCWGQNAQGSLGLGDSNHRGDGPNEMGDLLTAVPNGF
jgi:cysteine-rich repeat protein